LEPDWASRRPLYLQVRDALLERITNGTWRPQMVIPNEQELAREMGVSAGTMRKALDLLEAEHLVTRRQGRGTFINDQASEQLVARFSNLRALDGKRVLGHAEEAQVVGAQASSQERERLLLKDGALVYRIHRTRSHMGRTCMMEDVSLPAERFPGLLEAPDPTKELTALARDHGVVLGDAKERVASVLPSDDVARKLGIGANQPVLLLDRVIHALDSGIPVEWRIAHCRWKDGHYVADVR
jgi:GntR family transcriptional regulator